MTSRIGIIGAGGHGKVVADVAQRCGWSEVIFFDERVLVEPCQYGHWQVIDVPAAVESHGCDAFFVAIGDASARQTWTEWLLSRSLPLATLVDPSAVVSQYAVLEAGVLVVAGAVINVDSRISLGAIINTRASVDHDCLVGPYSHICPAAALAGGVQIGERSWVGIGSQVKQGVSIGHDAMVGAGATVIRDVFDSETVIGTPAQSI